MADSQIYCVIQGYIILLNMTIQFDTRIYSDIRKVAGMEWQGAVHAEM